MNAAAFDQDALVACADLVQRTGGKQFEVGFLHDDVPVEQAGWYAHAMFKGARITEDEHRGPVEACDALSRRLLTGARCRRCGKPVAISDAPGRCRWMRMGPTWVPGCNKPIDQSIPAKPLTEPAS